MSDDLYRIGVLKFGCIGAAPLLDLILDERADRKDIEVRAFSSGAKLDENSCVGPTRSIIDYSPHLVLSVSPNAALPGPTKSRTLLAEARLPTITVSDGPGKKAFSKKDKDGKKVKVTTRGQGFIILPVDSMIGARREFLDPTEMAIFNADIIKVLSITGVIRLLQNEIGNVIAQIKEGKTPEMPELVVTADIAIEHAGFANSNGRAKAYAAFKITEAVSTLTTKACFVAKDASIYIPMVAAGHEMLRAAASLADEAREIEKQNDTVLRTPHSSKGKMLRKTRLLDKPE